MTEDTKSAAFEWKALSVCVVVMVVLAVFLLLAKRPWFDEGGYANPAYNLLHHGTLGMPIWEGGNPLHDRAHWTFTMPPLHFVLQAGWYALFGIGVFQMRALSLLFGAICVVSLGVLVGRLSGNRQTGLIAALIASCDYTLLLVFSDGRMDAVSIGFGFAGLASWVVWRQDALGRASLIANTCIVLSGLTHPAGILYLFALLILAWPDRHRLRLRHLGLAAVPYVFGAIGWGLYIFQNVEEFRHQFFGETSGRLSFSDRLDTVLNGLKVIYGFGPTSGALSHFKIVVPLFYVSGAVLLLWRMRRAAMNGGMTILVLALAFGIVSTFALGAKLQYVAHALPLYAGVLAVSISSLSKRFKLTALATIFSISIGSIGYYWIKNNGYRDHYLPILQELGQVPNLSITGSSEFAFVFGFEGKLVDDAYLGLRRGRSPSAYFIEDENYRAQWDALQSLDPVLRAKIDELRKRYILMLDTGYYRLYRLQPD